MKIKREKYIIISRDYLNFMNYIAYSIPLFQEHREYFYDWCEIGSIYGAPGRLHLGRRTSRIWRLRFASGVEDDGRNMEFLQGLHLVIHY